MVLLRAPGQIFPDGSDEDLSEFGEFFLTDTADRGHQFELGRLVTGHETERHIGKDDISGDIPFVGECAPKSTEDVEELFVAGDGTAVGRFGAGSFRRTWRDRFGETDRAAIFQCIHPFGTQFDGGKATAC